MGAMDDIDSDDGENRAAKIEVLGQGAYKNPLRNAPTMPVQKQFDQDSEDPSSFNQ